MEKDGRDMARFSVGVEEDEEGPSNRPPKRPRTKFRVLSFRCNGGFQGERGGREQEEHLRGEQRDQEEEGDDHGEGEGDGDEEEEAEPDEQGDEAETVASEDLRVIGNSDSGRNTDRVGHSRDGSISMTLLDPEVFDCCICCEPLTIPIFQCDNGHIACSSCCTEMRNKCPSCSMPIGYNRCRAMEKVLEAVKVSCQNSIYGCKEMLCYSSKYMHEKECIYAPCSCPVSCCSFIGSYKQVYKHFGGSHKNSGICFLYGSIVSITLKEDDEFLILQEGSDGTIFILSNSYKHLGNMVTINCLAPLSPGIGEFSYELRATIKGTTLKLQSTAKFIKCRFDDIPSGGFLLIPSYLFGFGGQLKLELRIHK